MLEFCVATYKNCVATQTVFSTRILSFFNNYLQNTKLMNIPHFGIKIDLKLLKTYQKNGLKIDDFYTHQFFLGLKFLLVPKQRKENFVCPQTI